MCDSLKIVPFLLRSSTLLYSAMLLMLHPPFWRPRRPPVTACCWIRLATVTSLGKCKIVTSLPRIQSELHRVMEQALQQGEEWRQPTLQHLSLGPQTLHFKRQQRPHRWPLRRRQSSHQGRPCITRHPRHRPQQQQCSLRKPVPKAANLLSSKSTTQRKRLQQHLL